MERRLIMVRAMRSWEGQASRALRLLKTCVLALGKSSGKRVNDSGTEVSAVARDNHCTKERTSNISNSIPHLLIATS